MNSKLKGIFKRRSVRSYYSKPIPAAFLNDILEAAMAAPSACNTKPYDLIILDEKSLLSKVSECLPHGKFLADAPLGIVICGDIQQAHGNELSYMLQDCSAVIENILVAVAELDLGACWLGVHPREDRIKGIREIFNLPENIIPVSVVSIGYPDKKVGDPRTQYDAKKIHRNSW